MTKNLEFSRFKGARVTEYPDGSIGVGFDRRRSREEQWDVDLYIDSLDVLGLDTFVIRDDNRTIMIGLDVPDSLDPDGTLRAAYHEAYRRRGRVFDALPGETIELAINRVRRDRHYVKYCVN